MHAPSDHDELRRAVDGLLEEHLAALATELEPLGPACEPLIETLGTTLSGGKRLRAAFCYWAWRAHAERPAAGPGTGPEDHRRALRVGAALELFHAAALLHDDVMDASDTRRGHPSAHRAFESRHRAAGWSGDPERFGESAAILLGDLALVSSERELADAVGDLDPGRRTAARAIFDQLRVEVTAGQYLDVLAEVVPWTDDLVAAEHATRTVVRAKSARYSIEHPLTLGAALAGAAPADLDLLRRVGLPLGEAFQLRDDLLGVFGDPAATGKPAGDDLREGKCTLLAVRGLAAAGPQDAALLRSALGDPALTDRTLAQVRDLLVRTGAVAAVEAEIAWLADPALAELAAAPLADPGRAALIGLGRAAVHRDA